MKLCEDPDKIQTSVKHVCLDEPSQLAQSYSGHSNRELLGMQKSSETISRKENGRYAVVVFHCRRNAPHQKITFSVQSGESQFEQVSIPDADLGLSCCQDSTYGVHHVSDRDMAFSGPSPPAPSALTKTYVLSYLRRTECILHEPGEARVETREMANYAPARETISQPLEEKLRG